MTGNGVANADADAGRHLSFREFLMGSIGRDRFPYGMPGLIFEWGVQQGAT